MAAPKTKRDALIDEGLSEAEADYLMSGGTKTDGLNLSSDQPTITAEPVRDIDEPRQPPASTSAQQQAQPEPDEDEPDSNAAVPYQRYSRDKNRLKSQLKERDDRLSATTAELTAEREKWARLDERMRVFREAAEAPDPATQPQPRQKPDREADPFGYMAWQDEQIEELRNGFTQFTTRTQERDAAVELATTFRQEAIQYARTNPDFWESAPGAADGAYHFLMRNRDAELQMAGITDPQQRMAYIAADERDIVARALEAKQRNPNAPNPAEILFNLAVTRGYQKRAPATAAGANGAANGAARPAQGQPHASTSAQQPAGRPTVTQQVEAIKAGQAASRSLSTAGGAPPPQGIDLANIANMDDNEYAIWSRGLTPAQRREYMQLIGYMGR